LRRWRPPKIIVLPATLRSAPPPPLPTPPPPTTTRAPQRPTATSFRAPLRWPRRLVSHRARVCPAALFQAPSAPADKNAGTAHLQPHPPPHLRRGRTLLPRFAPSLTPTQRTALARVGMAQGTLLAPGNPRLSGLELDHCADSGGRGGEKMRMRARTGGGGSGAEQGTRAPRCTHIAWCAPCTKCGTHRSGNEWGHAAGSRWARRSHRSRTSGPTQG
jgi:hypothetical protein